VLRGDQPLKFGVELGKVGVCLDVVKRLVIAFIPLILPDVDCSHEALAWYEQPHWGWTRTERVAVAYLGPPATYEMHFVLRNGRHLWVPLADEFGVFVGFIWLDLVENDGVDIFAAS
jgi:hypothetical protein